MDKDEIIKTVREGLEQMVGVGRTLVLNEEDRKIIAQLEEKADQMTLMGLGRGDNKGVKTVLQCDVIIPFQTTMEYEWPCGPNVLLMHDGEVVGEDIDDADKLKSMEQNSECLVIGNIVIYDKSVLTSLNCKSEPLVVVMPPKPCDDVECLPHVCNATLASPSPPTDEYLKERMGLESEHGTGSFLLGFDFECGCE
ncbi:hypothetical protein [Methanococcoides methylutens]|uniref:Uncharacterized protein n=1 Tax=Methanococcoides methylutens MM1 TaxID=1434104 RepID=A0A0E3X181_METMT|nr:hypothetical protein [Methanococcoides methylutens]AKB85915.1 hypothetical protein MCMEM_1862 [Methanococcoides methylutens MM1]